ncbi:HEAT repeat domain-containing protein [Sorangium sp. So ce1128]
MKKGKSDSKDRQLAIDETANPQERAAAISRIGADRLHEYEDIFSKLLHHKEPSIRESAAMALVAYWGLSAYLDPVMHMLHRDPDLSCRLAASNVLCVFAGRHTAGPSERELVLRALVQSVMQDEDPMVQASSYQRFLKLVAPDRAAAVPDELDRRKEVDWKLIAPYLTQ